MKKAYSMQMWKNKNKKNKVAIFPISQHGTRSSRHKMGDMAIIRPALLPHISFTSGQRKFQHYMIIHKNLYIQVSSKGFSEIVSRTSVDLTQIVKTS